ncbi:MAG: hypothetical protein ACLSCV_11925 [Acutalibacteraceae bacterium]
MILQITVRAIKISLEDKLHIQVEFIRWTETSACFAHCHYDPLTFWFWMNILQR